MDLYTGTNPADLRKSPKGIIAAVIAVALVVTATVGTLRVMDAFHPIITETKSTDSVAELISQPDTSGTPDDIYITETVDNTELHRGSMILVNNNYGYVADATNLVSVYENKTSSYYVDSVETLLRKDAITALNSMMDEFFKLQNKKSVQLISGYRTQEYQQQLYDKDLKKTGQKSSSLVAKPGYSEHQTGLAMDFNLYNGDTSADFDGTGDYAWFGTHCAEYGFILRYPENKTTTTEIAYEPWHFRYIGAPHAFELTRRGLCLEEYIDLLGSYHYDSEHLKITNCDGKQYEVYTYPADTLADTTTVPVPAGLTYTICGDNVGSYIVTVDLGTTATRDEVAALTTTTTAAAATTTTATEATTTAP